MKRVLMGMSALGIVLGLLIISKSVLGAVRPGHQAATR